MENNLSIEKIEKALGYKLTPMTIKYLTTNEQCYWSGRICGKTTAYILKIVLNKNDEIYLSDLRRGRYTDEIHDSNYDRWFYNEVIKIRQLLVNEGIEVIKLTR